MNIDIKTLVFLIFISTLIQLAVIFIQYRINRTYSGLGWWLMGYIFFSATYSILFLRDHISIKLISIIAANVFYITGKTFVYIGICRFFTRKENLRFIFFIFLIFIPLYFYLTYYDDNINMRTFTVYAASALLTLMISFTIFRNRSESIRTSVNFNIGIFLVFGILFLVRSMMAWLIFPIDTIFTPSLIQTSAFLLLFIDGFFATFGLIILVNHRLSSDNRQISDKLEIIFNTTPDAVSIMSIPGGIFVKVNDIFAAMSGYTKEEIAGKSIEEIDIWNDRDEYYRLISKTNLNGFCENEEIVFRNSSGRQIVGMISAKLLKLDDIPHIISVIRDFTDRKNIEKERIGFTEELKRSNFELQQFANVASHDLQEPLRMITSYLQLIKLRYMDKIETEGLEFIDYAIDGATRQQSLIESLMEYSRIGSSGLNLQPVDINEVISDITKDLKSLIEETGLSIEYKPLPVITADKMQIHRLFMNLIQNGAKFRTEGKVPRILISSETDNGFIIFRVSDNGIGIAKECFERIFQIFQRLHTREEYPGTGIGLAVCRKIVEKHGGRIWVESEQGKGTTFFISFPVVLLSLEV